MVDAPIRRRASFFQLGAPAPYVYGAIVGTLCWLPVRMYEERHGSLLLAVVRAGLAGVIWGFFFLAVAWFPRPRSRAEADQDAAWDRTRAALRRGELPADEAGRAAVVDHLPAAHRGALLGALVGTVLLGVLIVLAAHVGWSASVAGFGLVLAVVLAVAARTERRVRRLRARLASGQDG